MSADLEARAPAPSAVARRLIDDFDYQRGLDEGEASAAITLAAYNALSAYVAGLEAEVVRCTWRPINSDTPRNRSILLTDGTNSGEGFWHDGSERHPSKGGAGWFSEMDRYNLLTAREWFGVVGWMDLPDAKMDAAQRGRVAEGGEKDAARC